jgi:hypothetical protein
VSLSFGATPHFFYRILLGLHYGSYSSLEVFGLDACPGLDSRELGDSPDVRYRCLGHAPLVLRLPL